MGQWWASCVIGYNEHTHVKMTTRDEGCCRALMGRFHLSKYYGLAYTNMREGSELDGWWSCTVSRTTLWDAVRLVAFSSTCARPSKLFNVADFTWAPEVLNPVDIQMLLMILLNQKVKVHICLSLHGSRKTVFCADYYHIVPIASAWVSIRDCTLHKNTKQGDLHCPCEVECHGYWSILNWQGGRQSLKALSPRWNFCFILHCHNIWSYDANIDRLRMQIAAI